MEGANIKLHLRVIHLRGAVAGEARPGRVFAATVAKQLRDRHGRGTDSWLSRWLEFQRSQERALMYCTDCFCSGHFHCTVQVQLCIT